MIQHKCLRCGESFTGIDEHDAEVKFSVHKCKHRRDLKEMPIDLLNKVATGQVTEDQAWEQADAPKLGEAD